jgi:hypothetical protein
MLRFRHRTHARQLRPWIAIFTLAALSACASIDVKPVYQPPQKQPIPSALAVQMPFDQAWNGFVRNLSTSFFVVNNISKSSRLINISVGRGRANNFVDCGTAKYKVNDKQWTFNPAKSATYNDSGFRSETVMEHKVTGHGGRMNIFVAPEGPTTVFEVNTSYAIEMHQSGYSAVRNLLGQVVSRERLPEADAAFELTTKSPDTQPLGNVMITCQATGVWEQLILDLVPKG